MAWRFLENATQIGSSTFTVVIPKTPGFCNRHGRERRNSDRKRGASTRSGLAQSVLVRLVRQGAVRGKLETILDELPDLLDLVLLGAVDPDGYLVGLGADVDDCAADAVVLRAERLPD